MLQFQIDDELPATIPYVLVTRGDDACAFASPAFLQSCGGDFQVAAAVVNRLLSSAAADIPRLRRVV